MKVGFLFSGQGSQYAGMMKDIFENNLVARNVYEIAKNILHKDISNLSFYGDQSLLDLTENTQPCIITAELAILECLKQNGLLPDAVAGFSLGEYATLVSSNCLDVATCIDLIGKRAIFMKDSVSNDFGGMVAVQKINLFELEKIITKLKEESFGIYVSNINSPNEIVVSGENMALHLFLDWAKSNNVRAVKLPVSAPFHSPYMHKATQLLKNEFDKIDLLDANIPIYMNVDGNKYQKADDIKNNLILQTESCINFVRVIENMYKDGIDTFVEIGPSRNLSKYVKKIINDDTVSNYNIDNQKSLIDILEILKGKVNG